MVRVIRTQRSLLATTHSRCPWDSHPGHHVLSGTIPPAPEFLFLSEATGAGKVGSPVALPPRRPQPGRNASRLQLGCQQVLLQNR